MSPNSAEPIQFARLPEGIVVIRVQGRGTHQQSPGLRHVYELTRQDDPPPRYILDLDQCVTMDSTFLGTLASIALHQRKRDGSSLIAANVNDHVRNLLKTLGLKFIMEIRPGGTSECAAAAQTFTPSTAPDLSKLDRIVLMLQAHERLVDIDSHNEVRFEGVLKSLRESLEREETRQEK